MAISRHATSRLRQGERKGGRGVFTVYQVRMVNWKIDGLGTLAAAYSLDAVSMGGVDCTGHLTFSRGISGYEGFPDGL